MNPETIIQNKIRIRLSEMGILTWRNNTFKLPDPKTGRWVQAGLCKGSSDIIGITKEGRFVAIEVKCYSKKPTKEQKAFIEAVKQSGGIAGVAYSADDAVELVTNA